jgi:hypothetical protein
MNTLEIGAIKSPPSALKFYRRENEYEIFLRTISFGAVLLGFIMLGLIGLGILLATDTLFGGLIMIAIVLYVFSSVFWMLVGWVRLVVKDDCIYYTTMRDKLFRNPPIVVALADLRNVRMIGGGIDSSGGSRGYRYGKVRGVGQGIELKMIKEKVEITFDSQYNAWVSIFLKRVHMAYMEREKKIV